jgi:hypothetical protein
MVSLQTTRLRRAIDRGDTAEEKYAVLARSGYLSVRALRDRENVLSNIQSCIDAWKAGAPQPIGTELSWDIERALSAGSYLSFWAGWWGPESARRW